jgi:hypothetical protein
MLGCLLTMAVGFAVNLIWPNAGRPTPANTAT